MTEIILVEEVILDDANGNEDFSLCQNIVDYNLLLEKLVSQYVAAIVEF